MKCGSTSSKSKVKAQLEAAKKKATPKGETKAQTTARSKKEAQQTLAKHKACGPGRAFNTRENRCEDIEKNAPAHMKEALRKKYVPIRAAEIQRKLALQQGQKFGSMDIATARAQVSQARQKSPAEVRSMVQAFHLIKTKEGQETLALRRKKEEQRMH